MTTRYYSSVATETTLVGGISAVNTSMQVQSVSGLPIQYPYVMAVDYEGATEELVEVTGAAGTTLTIVRAYDGTPAASHNTGARVRHVSSAQDFRDSRNHENATAGVHGVTGDVVGDDDIQTLTNKTISGGTFTGTIAGQPDFSDRVDFQNGISTTDDGAGVPLRVFGGPAQSASILLVENNAGTDLLRVAANGATLVDQVLTLNNGMNATGAVDINGTLDVSASITINQGPDFDGTLTVYGNAHVGDSMTVATTSGTGTILDVQKGVGQTGSLQTWTFGGTPLALIGDQGEGSFARTVSTDANVFTAGAGWTLVDAAAVETAGVATVNVTVQRSGANIVAGAGGDIADSLLGTFSANWRPNSNLALSDFAVLAQNSIGSGAANLAVTTGNVTLRSWNSSATISTGNNVNLSATFVQ